VGSPLVNGYLDNTDLYNLMKAVLPPEKPASGTVIRLNDVVLQDKSECPTGIARFLAECNPGAQCLLEIYDMNGGILFQQRIIADSEGLIDISWKPSKKLLKPPALYRYVWSVDGIFKGTHTFILR